MKVVLGLAALAIALAGCGGSGGGSGKGNPLPAGKKGQWTILVYMNGANNLERYSPANFNQMEMAATNPAVRTVVQWKLSQSLTSDAIFDGTRRYLVYPDQDPNAIHSEMLQDMGTAVDMGVPETLQQFITWGEANYPADHYLLVIWDHGNGWEHAPALDGKRSMGVSYDNDTHHSIETWQLAAPLMGQHLDAVAFDASLMQMAEVAYEIRDTTQYMVGSEESPPAEGFPYDQVFAKFAAHPTEKPSNLCRAFVDAMLADPAYASRKVTESVLDTSETNQLSQAASRLASVLIANPPPPIRIQTARNSSQQYGDIGTLHYHDMYGFASNLMAQNPGADIKLACRAVVRDVNNAVLYEGHNANSPGSHGLAVDLSTATQFDAANYSQLAWAKNTTWAAWLASTP